MNSYLKKSLTLIELLIAITLLSVIILAISNIDLFTRFHTISADRRVKLQNEVSYVLDHMSKEIGKAIGDKNQLPIDRTNIDSDTAIRIWIDYNNNGQRDTSDKQIVYRKATNYEIWYYSNYTDLPSSSEIIAKRITSDFSNTYVTYDNTDTDGDPIDNYIDIQLTACFDPDGTPNPCASPDNPNVTMSNRIKMPSVSTH